MALYKLTDDRLEVIGRTNFAEIQIKEREDIQRLLRDQIEIIDPDLFVIAEEFSNWQEGSRRVDLLAVDRDANIVVIELKRTEHGGHMELQAIRYAAMVSNLTFEQAAHAHEEYLSTRGINEDAEERILEFLQWDEVNEEDFGQAVRIILMSANFSRELTTSVLWLNERGLDIRCVRLRPHQDGDNVLIDVERIIPLPEAENYIVGVREKSRKKSESRQKDLTKFDVQVGQDWYRKLPKRQTIFRVVKALANSGHSPEEIWEGIEISFSTKWRVVEGEVDSEVFSETATTAASQGGSVFDPSRWFFQSDDLIYSSGNTYAFSKMWGTKTEAIVKQLLAKYPDSDIRIEKNQE